MWARFHFYAVHTNKLRQLRGFQKVSWKQRLVCLFFVLVWWSNKPLDELFPLWIFIGDQRRRRHTFSSKNQSSRDFLFIRRNNRKSYFLWEINGCIWIERKVTLRRHFRVLLGILSSRRRFCTCVRKATTHTFNNNKQVQARLVMFELRYLTDCTCTKSTDPMTPIRKRKIPVGTDRAN